MARPDALEVLTDTPRPPRSSIVRGSPPVQWHPARGRPGRTCTRCHREGAAGRAGGRGCDLPSFRFFLEPVRMVRVAQVTALATGETVSAVSGS
jgi:hypothetical protein